MTFKELQKIIHYRQSESNSDQTRFFNRLKDKPFWIWNVEQHKAEDIMTKGDCCFNHIIGLPIKDGKERPLYPYQKIVLDALADKTRKHVWIKKATGLGISELMLRYISWLCLKSNEMQNSQVCIVTGPNIEIATKLIGRLKNLFINTPLFQMMSEERKTTVEINGCIVEAYPSHHIDAMRGLSDVKFILLDEFDFVPAGQQSNSRDVAERYIAKSNPYIVMVSTPNQPNGLFEQIEKEPEDKCLYKRIFLDYTYGKGNIYSDAELIKNQSSPSWSREYCLHYGGQTGNCFSESSIQAALFKGERVPLACNIHAKKVLACDPGFGSSSFGICVLQLTNYRFDSQTNSNTASYSVNSSVGDIATVLYAEEFKNPNFEAMIAVVVNFLKVYGLYFDSEAKVYVDGSASAFIRSLKIALNEDPNYESAVERAHKSGLKNPWWLGKVQPITFGASGAHKAMLANAKMFLDRNLVAVHPKFTKLVIALRTAYETGENTLDKDRTAHNDVFDAFRMALKFFEPVSAAASLPI